MPTKTILVLANSIKKAPDRCIAGREVAVAGSAVTPLGPWVRPVSPDSEGKQAELYEHRHCRRHNGKSPQVLDVVTVALEG